MRKWRHWVFSIATSHNATVQYSMGLQIKWSSAEVRRLKRIIRARNLDIRNSEIINLYKSGWRCEEIAEKYNLSVNTIWWMLPKDITRKVYWGEKQKRNEAIRRLIMCGMSQRGVARLFNIDHSTVQYIWEKASCQSLLSNVEAAKPVETIPITSAG